MRKRIAMISEHASPLTPAGHVDSGGQNIYVAQVARHLARMGNDVDVFTRRDADIAAIIPWEDGVRVVNVSAGPAAPVKKERLLPFMSDFTSNMIDFIRMSPDPYHVVHANFWMSGLVAASLKNALRVPFAITFHALGKIRRLHQKEADEFPDIREVIERNVAIASDAVIAECPQDRRDLVSYYALSPEKIAMIPCGFDPEEFVPIDKGFARTLLGLSPKDKVILHLGRMVPRKGVDTVISAVAELKRRHGISAKLVVVGGELEGPSPDAAEVRRLKGIAQREGIADQVIFRGSAPREELKYYYSAADVFVTVPWYEPFGITPLEAMACGTPVIGGNVGGIKHTVRHGETGFLVPPKAPEAIADRLRHLYVHPELFLSLGRAGLRRVRNLFTWSNVAGDIDELLTDVAERRFARQLASGYERLENGAFHLLYETSTPTGYSYLGLDRRRMARSAS